MQRGLLTALAVIYALATVDAQRSSPRGSTTAGKAPQRISNGTNYVLVSRIESAPTLKGPGVEGVRLPGHYFLTLQHESDDPQLQPEREQCGRLESADGTAIRLGSKGVGIIESTVEGPTKPKPVTTCSYGVPTGTKGIFLRFEGYPRLSLGI